MFEFVELIKAERADGFLFCVLLSRLWVFRLSSGYFWRAYAS